MTHEELKKNGKLVHKYDLYGEDNIYRGYAEEWVLNGEWYHRTHYTNAFTYCGPAYQIEYLGSAENLKDKYKEELYEEREELKAEGYETSSYSRKLEEIIASF